MHAHLTLAGLGAGLALSPWMPSALGAGIGPWDAAGALGAAALCAAAARHSSGSRATVVLLLVSGCAGLVLGAARVEAIESGAVRAEPGARAEATGIVAAVPRRADGEVLIELGTRGGGLLVRVPEPVAELRVGSELSAAGVIAEPDPWREDWLRRRGIAFVLEARTVEPTGAARGGLGGRVDAIRDRAEAALGRGMPEAEEALARGFVLGQDDRIDPRTVEDFKRSGLAHLLAVSGQNVVLLCLLAWPLLALAGLTLRARLLSLLVLIAVYVAVTGAGPSIQRAGVMGAAGVVAGLAGTPRSRWYALLLAVVVTLGLNPLASGDVGWQLSFAATAGIMLWTARLSALLAGEAHRGSTRRALADGAAVTFAATLATAPLMAHHFDALPVAALPANLLALPAVAPAMWLGMLVGIAGQVPAIPVEPLNWLNSLLLAYIAQVGRWLGEPGWSLLRLGTGGIWGLALAYLGLVGLVELCMGAARRRAGLSPVRRPGQGMLRLGRVVPAMAVCLAVLVALRPGGGSAPPAEDALRVSVLDVGQGDAIVVDPPAARPILVDAGPPGAEVVEQLRDAGVDSLAALVITHDQSDHAGGAPDVLDSLAVERLAYASLGPDLPSHARATGAVATRLVEGSELRSGGLRLSVLWPPPERLTLSADDPNAGSLVLLAEWRHFSILLTGDAEAELVPLDPGPVDVLKVAHHGSEDSGLGSLLERTLPKLAVISVGENSYGHPTAETLGELDRGSVPTLRTDEDGRIEIEADPQAGAWSPAKGREEPL